MDECKHIWREVGFKKIGKREAIVFYICHKCGKEKTRREKYPFEDGVNNENI